MLLRPYRFQANLRSHHQPEANTVLIGKAYLYSAFRETSTQGAQVWITQGCPCKLYHTCLYLANVRQMAPPKRHTSDSGRYSFINPGRMKGWVGLVSWPIADVIHGHTSTTDRAEARESSPVRDRRSNHWATQPTNNNNNNKKKNWIK